MAQVNNLLIKGTARSLGKIKAPEFDGTLVGNSSTATKLATARTISLTGDVTGSGTFDGSENLSITATVVDDSHNHTIANVDNLQSSLNAKAPLASPALTGTPTAPTAGNATNNTQIATTAFVQSLVNSKIAAADAMIYKGTLGTGGTVTALPNTHTTGWTYKVITAGTYAGVKCEVGDMIVCLTDGTAAKDSDWTVIQTNIDGAVTGPASTVNGRIATFNGTTGKVIKDSGFTIATSVPANAKFTDTTYSAGAGISLSGTTFSNSGVREVKAGSSANQISVNTNGTSSTITINNVANATKATQDGDGKTISSTYAKLSGATFTGEVDFNGVHSDTYYASNLCRHFSGNTPTEFVIKTKIKFVSQTHMPVVRIYGYAYGLSSPIELRVGFYIFSDSFCNQGVSCTGAWKPEVYLFKYTENSVDYVAIGFKGSCYFAGFQVDAQIGASGSFGTNILRTGWSTENNGADTKVSLIPTVGTNKCVLVPYKTMKTDIEGSATSATNDSAGQQIKTTYIKGLSVSGKTITYTKGDGTTGTITTQDTTYGAATSSALGLVKIGSNITNSSGTISLTKANVTAALGYTPPTSDTTYSVFTGATSSANGTTGLVPAPASGKQTSFLRGDGTWVVPTNTTYSAGAGISLSGTTFSNSGVRSVNAGSSANQISVNTGGTTSTITVNNVANATAATTATKLASSKTLQVNLASTNSASFDGSSNASIGVTGTLPVANGGTGQTTAKSAANAFITALDTGSSDIALDDSMYIVAHDSNASANNWVKRSSSSIWSYINGKISSVLGLTSSSYGGNSATATKATQDSAGQQINKTYIKSLSVSGKTITYTKGDGSTGTITTQDTNTDTKVTQTVSTANSEFPLLGKASTATSTVTDTSVFAAGVSVNPSKKELKATSFSVGGNAVISYNATTGCLEFTV